jgi:putative FmdB family regulatory protein
MPLYEYRCEGCGEVFEVMQKFSDQPLTTHEKCGGSVHRLLSAPALQFKGSGWYITDYAKGSGSKANGSSKKDDASSKSDSSTSASSDSSSKATPSTSSSTSDTK